MAPAPDTKAGEARGAREYKLKFLRHLLRCGAVKFGKFRLKDGRISPYFINLADAMKTGEDANLVAEAYVQRILEINEKSEKNEKDEGFDFDYIHGVAYKGIPIAALIASHLSRHGMNKRWGYHRKEEKAYGDLTEQRIVGDLRDGDRVLIVDDVLTTGRTKIDVWEMLRSQKDVEPAGILVAVDREEMTDEERKNLCSLGLQTYSILKISEILRLIESSESGFK